MDTADLRKHIPITEAGELVVQNGRQAGARRPLCVPTTFIGRNPDCEIRLNVDGVDPLHCVLIVTSAGIRVRDLGSRDGTFVNDQRVDHVALADGDVLKVGPFQFRIERAAPVAGFETAPVDDLRDALRVQASAIAAQQAALEEEEMRLHQRRADLQQQEEQLAAHLAEKQREVQVWSEHTGAEREALLKEKIEQEKEFDRLEQEIREARADLDKDHQQLTQERQRINKVYQRLRVRWQRQWSGEREKYENHVKTLAAQTTALDERRAALAAQEAVLKQERLQFSADRELAARQLQDARATLRTDQIRWRRRRSLELAVLKGIERRIDEAQVKLKQARQLLVAEKENWDKQVDVLQKELHGLNNRIVHQRLAVQAGGEELARLDATLRDRQMQVNEPPLAMPVTIKPIVVEDQAPKATDDWQVRFDTLNVLTGELADQRVQLIEQYKRLVEIEDEWQLQRDQAAHELEAVAKRLLEQQQTLDQRDQQMESDEVLMKQRLSEMEATRQDLMVWRAQLKVRDHAFAAEHERNMAAVAQHDARLQEQLAELEQLRARWQECRQQELDALRERRTAVEQEMTQTQRRRVALFEKGQHLDHEKRILAEKALALEEFRQEILVQANDPTAQRRIEHLRRRWLTLNSAVICNAKAEREAARQELQQLEVVRADLTEAADRIAQSEASASDAHASLQEREAMLKAHRVRLDADIAKHQEQHPESDGQHLRWQEEIDAFAHAVYENQDTPPPIDRAA